MLRSMEDQQQQQQLQQQQQHHENEDQQQLNMLTQTPVKGEGGLELLKKRRRVSGSGSGSGPGSGGGSSSMTKELTGEQKALVKMHVSRESSEGIVKCCHCEKEITSKNIDRWASHLRGCLKTPEHVKAQIQPFRSSAGSSSSAMMMPNVMSQHNVPLPMVATPNVNVSTNNLSNNNNLTPSMQVATTPSSHLATFGTTTIGTGYNEVFKVHVSKDYMKFNAAHFIAYKGFREKLHGHNYRVGVTISGTVGPDGYVVDFGEIKKISRVICKDLNESFLVPMNSDALKINFDGANVHILTEDMAKFSFPKSDCSLLPIVHSSAEELAIYFSNQLIDAFTLTSLVDRGVRKLEVSISEAHQQMACYERTILA